MSMKLSTDELIAIGAALEIALNSDGIEAALTDTKNCHDPATVSAMLNDWRKLRGRITGYLVCPDDGEAWEVVYTLADADADAKKDEDARRDEDPRVRS